MNPELDTMALLSGYYSAKTSLSSTIVPELEVLILIPDTSHHPSASQRSLFDEDNRTTSNGTPCAT